MTLAEIYSKQNSLEKKQEEPSSKKELVIHMPEVAMLIKHLDLLYTKMLMQDETKEVSWFNNGQGIKQTERVT